MGLNRIGRSTEGAESLREVYTSFLEFAGKEMGYR